jgi:hypothetical protein
MQPPLYRFRDMFRFIETASTTDELENIAEVLVSEMEKYNLFQVHMLTTAWEIRHIIVSVREKINDPP